MGNTESAVQFPRRDCVDREDSRHGRNTKLVWRCFAILMIVQTQGMFNAAKKLTEKMRKKGMLTRKSTVAGEGTGGDGKYEGDGDSDYEIREDGVELTGADVVRRKTGTWATVGEAKEGVDC